MPKKNLLLIICLVISIVLLEFNQSSAGSRKEALELLDSGNKMYDAGRYKEAVEKYRKSWDMGKLAEACYNLATTLDIELNRNEESVIYYKKYFALVPNDNELDDVYELMKKAKTDSVKEGGWKSNTEKVTADFIETLEKEYQDIQKIKYDDTAKKELMGEDGKPFTGSASVCLGCHGTFMGPKINMNSTHPVGRIPKGKLAETVPKNVRFYKEGRIICLSCHNPKIIHFESGAKGKTYRVLRVDTGKKGENMPKFCAFCHREKSSMKFLGTGKEAPRRRRRRRNR